MIYRIVIALAVSWSTIIFAQNNDFDQSAVSIRSTFFLHVVNYSRWDDELADLKFCLLEQEPKPHFQALQEASLVNQSKRKLHLQQVNNLPHALAQSCDYVFVDKLSESKTLFKDLKQISLTIVTIGESTAFIKNGGLISLIEEDEKIKIYVNRQQYQVSPVKFSARLLKYANFTG